MVSMRDFLRSSGRWLSGGWFWPLALLALPACAFQTNGLPNPDAFDPGPAPQSSAVMCDIAKPPFDDVMSNNCATASDVANGMPLGHAAVALWEGDHKPIGLDYSPDALNACNQQPRKTEFYGGTFPDGLTVCLNCGTQIPAKFPTPTAVCVAKCKELVTMDVGNPVGGVDAYCQKNAHVSTNFAPNICFSGACTAGGTPNPNFSDPRRVAEDIKWTDLIGTSASGNSLQRTAATTGPAVADFNAGGASEQLITKGDAWIEFEANDNTVSQVLGVRESCDDVTACPDTDPSLSDIGFSIILNSDQHVYVIESSPSVQNHGPFGTYNPHDKFRVHVTDNSDGTATISYSQVTGPCTPGTMCIETPLYQHVGPNPKYPLRIDASFREQNATVANVTLMRIQ
jgi:hypothetical protein